MKHLSLKNALLCLFILAFFACNKKENNEENKKPDDAQSTYILSARLRQAAGKMMRKNSI